MGLPAYYGTILSEHAMEEIDLDGIGRLVALTPNDEVNSLSALHFVEIFGRSEIYQLPTRQDGVLPKMAVTRRLRGRHLFGEKTTYDQLSRLFAQGAVIKKTPLTEEFDFTKFKEHYGADALPLMLIDREEMKLRLCTKLDPPKPKAGDVLLSLVRGDAEQQE